MVELLNKLEAERATLAAQLEKSAKIWADFENADLGDLTSVDLLDIQLKLDSEIADTRLRIDNLMKRLEEEKAL